MSLSVIILVAFCSTSPPVRARRRHGPAVADREPTSATELNLCRCTKAQDRLKILLISFPPSILLWPRQSGQRPQPQMTAIETACRISDAGTQSGNRGSP